MTSEETRRDMSLRAKMLILFGSAFIVIFSLSIYSLVKGVPFLSFKGLYAIGEENALKSISELADAKKEKLALWIDERKSDVAAFSGNHALKGGLSRIIAGYSAGRDPSVSREFRNILSLCNNIANSYAAYEKIQMIDPKTGRIVLSTLSDETGAFLEDKTRFSDSPVVIDDVIITIEKSGEKDPLHFTTSKYISMDDGRVIGVVIFYSDLGKTITPLLHTGIGMGESGEIVLINQDGNILAPLKYPLPDGKVASPLEYAIRAGPALLATEGVETLISAEDYRGVAVLAATRHIDITMETGWGMVVKKDRQEILAPIRATLFSQMLIMVVSLCALFGVTYFLSVSVSKPIFQLAETAARIKAGNMRERSRAGGFREINALTESFNSMAEQIENSHAHLESEVAQRTRELAEREHIFKAIFEQAAVGVAQINSMTGEFVMINRKYCDIVGFSREEMTQTTFQAITHPDDLTEDLEKMKRLISGEIRTFTMEKRYCRKDGAVVWVNLTVSPFWQPGEEPTFHIAVIEDITERKQTEDEIRRLNAELEERVKERTRELNNSQVALLKLVDDLKQSSKDIIAANQALELANRELEAFSYSVSHDLRAPLRGIDGWSQALLEDYGDKLDEEGQKCLGRVRSETQRMGHLIDDLLHLSRVTRADLQKSRVDLSKVAGTISEKLSERDPSRHVEFVIQPDLVAEGDSRLLNILLTNLLDNAWKFTGRNSSARIEFGRTKVDGQSAFFVRDNGAGFDMAYSGKLFGVFQRMHKVTEYSGTGIGLATVKRIAHRHGGRVWAEAEVNRGATFYFTLEDTHGKQEHSSG